jgi:AraC-like DNA-binding protein
MNLNTFSPFVRYAARSYLRAPFKIGRRIIFDYELIYLESGSFLLTVEDQEYICKKGDVIFLRPGQPHCLESLDGCSISQPHVHFDMRYDTFSESVYISYKDLTDFTEEEKNWIRPDLFAGIDMGPLLKISDVHAFRDLLFEIISDYFLKAGLYQLDLKQKMLRLLQIVIRDNVDTYEDVAPKLDIPAMVKQFIDYNYKNIISLDTLEQQFHYSRYYLSRSFAEFTGMPIIKYYNAKRLAYAKEMLREGAGVTQVANELNFSSIYSFSRFFKNATGCSPTQYHSATDILP